MSQIPRLVRVKRSRAAEAPAELTFEVKRAKLDALRISDDNPSLPSPASSSKITLKRKRVANEDESSSFPIFDVNQGVGRANRRRTRAHSPRVRDAFERAHFHGDMVSALHLVHSKEMDVDSRLHKSPCTTLLMEACRHGIPLALTSLLSKGADVLLVDSHGRTAMDYLNSSSKATLTDKSAMRTEMVDHLRAARDDDLDVYDVYEIVEGAASVDTWCNNQNEDDLFSLLDDARYRSTESSSNSSIDSNHEDHPNNDYPEESGEEGDDEQESSGENDSDSAFFVYDA